VKLAFHIFILLCKQLRSPKEVTTQEYNEFYRNTFNEYLDPLASSHFTTEVLHFEKKKIVIYSFVCIAVLSKAAIPDFFFCPYG
jgi:Hsp90 protein